VLDICDESGEKCVILCLLFICGENSTFTHDFVTFPAETVDLSAALKALRDVPSYELTDREGDPVTCLKCGSDTHWAKGHGGGIF